MYVYEYSTMKNYLKGKKIRKKETLLWLKF